MQNGGRDVKLFSCFGLLVPFGHLQAHVRSQCISTKATSKSLFCHHILQLMGTFLVTQVYPPNLIHKTDEQRSKFYNCKRTSPTGTSPKLESSFQLRLSGSFEDRFTS
jgi:hypothetical protein